MKSKAIEQLEAYIVKYQALLEAAEQMPELPEFCHFWASPSELRIHIPYNLEMFKEVTRVLSKAGYSRVKENGQWTSDEGTRFYHFVFGEVELIVTLCLSYAGAICQRVRVGTKEVPVYEVVCNE